MTGKTISSIVITLLLIVGGFWLFNRDQSDLAWDNNINATTTAEDLTGTGGAEEGFDPLKDLDGDEEFLDKG